MSMPVMMLIIIRRSLTPRRRVAELIRETEERTGMAGSSRTILTERSSLSIPDLI